MSHGIVKNFTYAKANFFKYCIELPFKKDSMFLLSTHREMIQKMAYVSVDMSYIKIGS